MKLKKLKFLMGVIPILILKSCCISNNCEDDGSPFVDDLSKRYEAIYIKREDLDTSIKIEKPKVIENSGKIYVKDKFLFINEQKKGFHIYDNSDPSNPKPLNFLQVLGSTDLAIRNNTFYVNQATDLITISINSEENSVNVDKRIPDIFPEIFPNDGFFVNSVPQDHIVVDWIEVNNKK